jgi:hypothetical protein
MNKLCMLAILLLISFSAFATEPKKEEANRGLSAGVDYYTDYFWRGVDFYGENRGAVFPYANYAFGDSGFTIGYLGEYSAEVFGDGATTFERIWYGADFSVEYAHTFKKTATVKAKYIYQWYYDSIEQNRKVNNTDYDESFMTGTVSLTIDGLPLSPTILYSRDYYVDDYGGQKKQGKDYYVQAQLKHTLALNEGSNLALSGGISYYNMESAKVSPATSVKRGISDVTMAADLIVTHGGAGFHGCLNYAYVPDSDWYRSGSGGKANRHHYWAVLGVSYSL